MSWLFSPLEGGGQLQAGGGSLNISAGVDALTLAEYPATIGKSLNIAATADALTLAEYSATVSLSRNVAATVDALTLTEYAATIGTSGALNISATAAPLTLAEHAATIGLSLNVQAGSDALTLAEYAAAVSLAINVQATTDSLTLTEYPASLAGTLEVQATTDALTLAEHAATLTFALNVSCNVAALTLAEHQATITAGEETSRPLGLSPWHDYTAEPEDTRKARIREQRERMGIVDADNTQNGQEPTQETERASGPKQDARSEPATRPVLQLADARNARLERIDSELRVLAALEAMEAERLIARQNEIRRRVALILIAAEA